nr:GFA family protein [Phenylobacterium glaciei]
MLDRHARESERQPPHAADVRPPGGGVRRVSGQEPVTLAGGCLCGQVRYEARGEPLNVRCCHCTLCQKAGGTPFYARAMFALGDITLTGETLDHPTSDRLMRRSCARCGTLVFSQPNDLPARIAVGLPTLDDPGALAPDMHIFTSTMLAWLKLDDDLPQYLERPPA